MPRSEAGDVPGSMNDDAKDKTLPALSPRLDYPYKHFDARAADPTSWKQGMTDREGGQSRGGYLP